MLITVSLTVVLIVLVGLIKPEGLTSGVPKSSFFARKLFWNAQFDLVVGGNSTVYQGVSPQAMDSVFPQRLRIANFGFSAVAYSKDYLENLERLLDPASKHKTLVLAFTPGTLLEKYVSRNGYQEEIKRSRLDLWMMAYGDRVLSFFHSVDLKLVQDKLLGRKLSGRRDHYYDNGWVATVPLRYLNKKYEKKDNGDRVSTRIMDQLLDYVEKWSHAGIKVFGLRSPESESKRRAQTVLGWDQREFARRFQARGGVWLFIDQNRYRTFDGAHLDRKNAAAFSKDFARMIVEYNNGKAGPLARAR